MMPSTLEHDHLFADELLAEFMAHYAWRKPFCGPVALVYRVINRYSRLPDGARPTIDTIATEAGVSPSTVKRAVRTLVDAGLLEVVPRFDKAGRPLPNLYRLLTVPETKAQVAGRVKFDPGYMQVDVEPDVVQEPESCSLPDTDLLHSRRGMQLRCMPPQGDEPQGLGGAREEGVRRRNFFDLARDAYRVVDSFADHLMARDGKIDREEFRRGGWTKTAHFLVVEQRKPVDEVLGVIAICFAHTHELADEVFCEVETNETMPHWMHWHVRPEYTEIRLTRLIQIQQHYDLIRAAMERNRRVSGVWVHPPEWTEEIGDDADPPPPLDPTLGEKIRAYQENRPWQEADMEPGEQTPITHEQGDDEDLRNKLARLHRYDPKPLPPDHPAATRPHTAALCGGGTLSATITAVRPTHQEGCRP